MKKLDINPIPPNFAKYIDLVADTDLKRAFDESSRQLNDLDKEVLEKLGDKRYAPGKWTVKDILQHLADSDRIMSYQALMLARKDESVLQGFDEKLHVKNANALRRTVDEMIEEIKVARASTILYLTVSMTKYFCIKPSSGSMKSPCWPWVLRLSAIKVTT